jgi:hypothetical protein
MVMVFPRDDLSPRVDAFADAPAIECLLISGMRAADSTNAAF